MKPVHITYHLAPEGTVEFTDSDWQKSTRVIDCSHGQSKLIVEGEKGWSNSTGVSTSDHIGEANKMIDATQLLKEIEGMDKPHIEEEIKTIPSRSPFIHGYNTALLDVTAKIHQLTKGGE